MFSKKLFTRDFTMVVIGQIISLFGNAVLRFALPLYLLNQTGSAALFGMVSAISFIPMILIYPVGGIIADRINKRNIMVILDFSTAALALICTLFLGKINIVILIVTVLIILYGIQGAYQPSVQASIPALVENDELVPANSVVTLVNSLAGLIGPVIGGAVYSTFGITPVLIVSIACFIASAVMEIFIRIPFEKKESDGSIISIAVNDMKQGIRFIRTQKPIIAKVSFYIAAINLVFSALIMIGLPVIITQKLGFDTQTGSKLYGFCQGTLAAGGLIGGILSGLISKKLKINNSHIMIYICSFSLVLIGCTMLFKLPSMLSYIIILICCLLMMIASTIFSIQMMSYAQSITPSDLIGKVMALTMGLCMCASPLGQAIYGWIFERMSNSLYIVFFTAAVISAIIAVLSRKSLKTM